MTFRFDEKTAVRRTNDNPLTYESTWSSSGELSIPAVRLYANAAIPYLIAVEDGILYRDGIELVEKGYGVFDCIAKYVTSDQQKPAVGQLKFSFSTTGGSFHITHSRSTVAKYPSTAVDYKQAINVRKNGNDLDIDGTDIIIPALKLSYTFTHPLGNVNEAFARTVASVTACCNSASFRGFQPGEVLFLGADGSDGTSAEAEVTYHFACESNLQDHIIGSITGINKDGHDLMWVNSKNDTASGKPTITPLGVYIERVYQRIDLKAALGWG